MIALAVFTIIFLGAAGVANYIEDTLSLGVLFYESSLQDFEDDWFAPKAATWGNKYKMINGVRQKKNGERWPTSSTATVFLTDGWHFFQFLTFTFMVFGACMCYSFCLYFFSPSESVIITLATDKLVKGFFFELTKRLIK